MNEPDLTLEMQIFHTALGQELKLGFKNVTDRISDARSEQLFVAAKDSLEELSSGGQPSYDLATTLLYAYRYLPCHVQLAYKLIRLALDRRDKDAVQRDQGRELLVIDFGAGCLAMQFGLVVVVSEFMRNNGTVPPMRVVSMDKSQKMLDFGQRLWNRFVSAAQTESDADHLRGAISLVDPDLRCIGPDDFVGDVVDEQDESRVWVSALHSFYECTDQNPSIRPMIKSIAQSADVEVGLFSTFTLKSELMVPLREWFENHALLRYEECDADEYKDRFLNHYSKHTRFTPGSKTEMLNQIVDRGFIHDVDEWCPFQVVADVYTRKRVAYPKIGGVQR